MAFANIGKLKTHLADGGTIEDPQIARDAMLVLIDELETLRGQHEAQKLLVAELGGKPLV